MSNGKHKSQGRQPKDPKAPANGHPRAPQKDPSGLEITPLVNEINCLVDACKAYKTANSQEDKKHLLWDRITAFGTVVAALGALIYGGIAYSQWRDANANFRTDQRAWIAVRFKTDTTFDIELGKTVEVPFTVSNVGKTPAKSLTGQFVTLPFAKDDPVRFIYDHGTRLTYPIMIPNEPPMPAVSNLIPYGGGIPISDPPVRQLITPSLHYALTQQGAYLATYGRMSYRDVFGDWHWVHACSTASPTGTMKLTKECVEYNDTGDGKDPSEK